VKVLGRDVGRNVWKSSNCLLDKKGKLCGIITQSDFGDKQQGIPYSMEILVQSFTQAKVPAGTERAREEARATTANQVIHMEVITSLEDTPVDELASIPVELIDSRYVSILQDLVRRLP
jgi:hypothetical protein